MLRINMTNGMEDDWHDDEYTDYEYRNDIFIVIDENQWVGIYNMRDVSRIVYFDEPEENKN